MKTLTVDLHPGAGAPITYENPTSWKWEESSISIVLNNGTIVRFNPTYVIALVYQDVEDHNEEDLEKVEECQKSN